MALEILSVLQMAEADRRTIEGGVPGADLMEAAGQACARAICARWTPRPVAVLCGPGNNGGDGFVIARALRASGWEVRVSCLVPVSKLKGDAAHMAGLWEGEIFPLTTDSLVDARLVVDAVFGAGLSRPVDGVAAEVLTACTQTQTPLMAVDVPSGVEGGSGKILGMAPMAALTVTFARKKIGHVLMPGRLHCGAVTVVDIGIPERVIAGLGAAVFENTPDLWRAVFPRSDPLGHKYDRGHAVAVSGGPSHTGAARLAARGALRAGAGLVTVACPKAALLVNAAHLTTEMVRAFEGPLEMDELLQDSRKNAVVIGPGGGVGADNCALVRTVLRAGCAAVLDADALTSFAGQSASLFELIHDRVILTPHEGEFQRLFPGLLKSASHRLDAARTAARLSGAVIVLKGPDTVIAAPEGGAALNTNAPPFLATAGSGDVLGGIITGLLAQGMPVFEAACAGVWLHGEAGHRLGTGLIAEDLPQALPAVLQALTAPVPRDEA